jgi:hypothetical protein
MSHVLDPIPDHFDREYVARLLREMAALVERTRVMVEESRRLVEKAYECQKKWQLPGPAGGAKPSAEDEPEEQRER